MNLGSIGKKQGGSSAVEFALVMPVFFALFMGIIEYGWVMTSQVLLSHAVAKGARTALRMPDETNDAIESQARDSVKDTFDIIGTLSDEDIDVEIQAAGSDQGAPLPRRIIVAIKKYDYTPLVGFLPESFVPRTLHSRAVFSFP